MYDVSYEKGDSVVCSISVNKESLINEKLLDCEIIREGFFDPFAPAVGGYKYEGVGLEIENVVPFSIMMGK